jgi:trigger factor
MKVVSERLEGNIVELKVEVPVEQVDKALQQAYKQVVRQVTLPGFRKGKAPRKLLESRFGVEIFYEDALDILLNESYPEAVDEAKIEPVDTPEVKETNLEQGKPFTYTAIITVLPEVKLGEYKGVAVDKEEVEVSEEMLSEELKSLRQQHARLETVEEEAISGDTVVIDYTGSVDGEEFAGGAAENYLLELGSNSFIPGFEDQLIGKKANDEVDVIVTFPENYQAEELAGKEAKFEVVVHEVKRKVIPELNEDFVLETTEFETVEEFTTDTKEKLALALEQQADATFRNQLLDNVVSNCEVEIPEVMIQSEIDRMLDDTARNMQAYGIGIEQYAQMLGKTMEDLRSDMHEQAARRVKTDLVLGAIVKEENIEINEEMFEERLAEMAQAYNQEVAELKKMLHAQPEAIESLQDGWKKDQAIELLVENAEITLVEKAKEESQEEETEENLIYK